MDISHEYRKPLPANTTDTTAATDATRTASATKRQEPVQTEKTTVPDNQPPSAATTAARQNEVLTNILKSYGYKPSTENIRMLTFMLENKLPLTQENIAKMNQALKLTGMDVNALFLVQNGIKLNAANAAQLNGLVEGNIKITTLIQNLLQSVSELQNPELREKLLQILGLAKPGASAGENVLQGTGAERAAQPQAQMHNAGIQGGNAAAVQTGGTVATNASALPSAATTSSSAPTANGTVSTNMANIAQNTQASSTALPNDTRAVHLSTADTQTRQADNRGHTVLLSDGETFLLDEQDMPIAARREGEHTAHIANNRGDTVSQSGTHKLVYQPENSTAADLDRFVNTIRETIQQIRSALSEAGGEDTAKVLRQTQSLQEHIDFTAQIKNQLFIQLPMMLHQQEIQTALHIFKEGGGNKNAKKSNVHSALVALDTAFMGHFETYIQKKGNSVTCQFRLANENIEQLVRANMHKLDTLLRQYHFTLDSFSFYPANKAFTLLDSPDESTSVAPVSFLFDKEA